MTATNAFGACNETQRCAADRCEAMFVQPATGRPRKYCSLVCRVRDHRTRQLVLPPAAAPPKRPALAHQRAITERHRRDDPRPLMSSLDGCTVEAISRAEAEEIILAYEWLGTMGPVNRAFYGLRAPGGELLGTVVFGMPGSAESRDVCGVERRGQAICLERGACVHYSPANAASFLISRATKLAAAGHGWRIFYAYADPEAGETGTVYQACNWLYIGQGTGRGIRNLVRRDWMIPEEGNRVISSRTLTGRGLTERRAYRRGWVPVHRLPKHKYVHFEGSRTERKQLMAALRYPVLPYPKTMTATNTATVETGQ
jgi:hypothetical protein